MDWIDNQIVLEFYKRKEKLIIPEIDVGDLLLNIYKDLSNYDEYDIERCDGIVYQIRTKEFEILTPADAGYEYTDEEDDEEEEYIPYLNLRVNEKNVEPFIEILRRNMQADDCICISFYTNNGADIEKFIKNNFKTVECKLDNQMDTFHLFLIFPQDELGAIVKEIII
jgi:hypothetical protein